MRGRFVWVLSAWMAWSTVGCLVTDKIDFEVDEQFPPSIVSAPDAMHPLNRIAELVLVEENEMGEFPLEVVVRDANVNQELQYRLFIDGPPLVGPEFPDVTGTIMPTGEFERDLNIFISFEQLGDPGECHRLELLVTGEFANFVEPRRPQIEGDLDQATWWVEVTSPMNQEIVVSCR